MVDHFRIYGYSGDIYKHGYDHAGANEGLLVQPGFEKKGAAEGALVTGKPSEETAKNSSQGQIPSLDYRQT